MVYRVPQTCALVLALALLTPVAATAQIAVSANDGKSALNDGKSQVRDPLVQDSVFVIDLNQSPPKVIGDGNHRPLRNETRSFYISCLGAASVRGRSSIVEVADMALADYQGEELARIDDEVEFDSAVFHRDRERLWTISPDGDGSALELEAAFSLLGCRTDFFGDWLSDSICKYVAAEMRESCAPVRVS